MTSWIFAVTTFLGSYLLFVVQPMVGKILLPTFGGVSSVWTTVMLFFMTVLLSGYGYVVYLSQKSKRRQFYLHAVLVSLSALLLVYGLIFGKGHVLTGNFYVQNNPTISLLLALKTLLLPCLLLASTSVIIQSWLAKIHPQKSPYWLYVISNAGSLLGLLSYPLIIEPNLTLKLQQTLWVSGVFLYFGFLISSVIIYARNKAGGGVKAVKPRSFDIRKSLPWFALPFVSTSAMLALTNYITLEISPIPYIWVATLGVYLLSFIVAFIGGRWYPRRFYGVSLLFIVIILYAVTSGFIFLKYSYMIPIALAALFIIGLVCHRELFRVRPKPEYLSIYYLIISLGGVAASIFVGIVAPKFFGGVWEYPITLVAAILVGVFVLIRNSDFSYRLHAGAFGVLVMVLVGLLFSNSWKNVSGGRKTVASFRNFYGVINIFKNQDQKPFVLELYNGDTSHGTQIIGNDEEKNPTSYYAHSEGLGWAILNHPKRVGKNTMRFGVIGLGAGTNAAYCGEGDYIRFYEINPQVIKVSKDYFTYISNAEKSGCKVEIVEGDARLSMEKELRSGQQMKFDILAVDAFTSDSIPVHLLTSEATDLYLGHLAEGGVIVFHISSRYFNLAPILEAIAAEKGLYFNDIRGRNSRWVLISTISTGSQSYIPAKGNAKVRPWTDDYSNVLGTLN